MKQICALALVLCIFAPVVALASTDMDHIYPSVGIVFYLDYREDLVFFVDAVGHIWSIEEVEDWTVGDTIVTIMFDNYTPNTVTDDSVIKYQYGGHAGMDLLIQWMRGD